MPNVIVSNQARCKICNDTPFSSHVHDYKSCKCGAMAVDGGTEYLKRSAVDLEQIEEMSVTMTEEQVAKAIAAVIWANKNKRNERGVAYAVIRALRDTGIDLNVKDAQ